MSWRRVPPVHSPVAVGSLIRATGMLVRGDRAGGDSVAVALGHMFDAPEVVLTNSGTSALILALRAAVKPQGIVALPAYVCIDVIAAAIRAGVRVTLYDVDPRTLSPDLDSARAALRRGAGAIVVAPLYGYPIELTALTEMARLSGAWIVEDAAQSAGATINARRCGSFGDLSVLSFGRGKGTTGGAGGALLAREASLRSAIHEAGERMPAPRRGGRELLLLAAQWLLARPALYGVPASIPALKLGEMVYHAASEPLRMSIGASAVLATAFQRESAELAVRREHAKRLVAAADRRRFTPIQPAATAHPGYLRLAMLDAGGTEHPNAELGVLRGYPMALDEHPETHRVLADKPDGLVGARELRSRLFTLPTHSRASVSDINRLARWLGSPAGASDVPQPVDKLA